MESLLNRLNVGVLLLTTDGRIEFVNRFCIDRELSVPEFRGKKYYETFRNLRLISLLGEFLSGECTAGEFEHREKHYRVTLSGGEPLLIQIEDITPLREAERLQKEFVASVSHELSTPLTAVRNLLETAVLSEKPSQELIRKALRRVEEFEKLISSVRMLTVLEVEKRRVFRDVDIGEIIGEVIEDLRTEIEEKRIGVSVSAGGKVSVSCDRDKIYILLRNVIENAVRYNREEGRIRIETSEGGGTLTVSVEDTGRGIPPEDLPFICDPFFRKGEGRGLGLGLAISSKIARFCGGSIAIESKPGAGTKVRITLPLQRSNL